MISEGASCARKKRFDFDNAKLRKAKQYRFPGQNAERKTISRQTKMLTFRFIKSFFYQLLRKYVRSLEQMRNISALIHKIHKRKASFKVYFVTKKAQKIKTENGLQQLWAACIRSRAFSSSGWADNCYNRSFRDWWTFCFH